MAQRYPKLCIRDFGKHLIETGDLDPVYYALHKMQLPHEQLCRWLLAYWCFYHAGLASYMSELTEDDYWNAMKVASINEPGTSPVGERWPRGKERRYWRGKPAIKGTALLSEVFPVPEEAVFSLGVERSGIVSPQRLPYLEVRKRVKEWYCFGDWIAFKVADMMERVLGIGIDFTHAEVFMFKDPYESALMQWKIKHDAPQESTIDDEKAAILEVVNDLTEMFSEFKAPPRLDRPIGLQEVETILCKYKSHMRGHYPLFNDILEIQDGVLPWAEKCMTALTFYSHFPLGE